MKKIGLIYSYNTKNTKKIAEQIKKNIGESIVEDINAEKVGEGDFMSYDCLILGVPTWFDGELPNYWDEFLPELEGFNLRGKKIAIFGLGDQQGYPENFVDSMGIIADILEKQGAKIVGYTSAQGYTFEKSKALRDGKFTGLAIDIENQSKLIDKKIEDWSNQLHKEFGL